MNYFQLVFYFISNGKLNCEKKYNKAILKYGINNDLNITLNKYMLNEILPELIKSPYYLPFCQNSQ